MSCCVTTQVSLLLVTFSIKANFEKEYLWKSIYLRFPGSLKTSSSICYVLFSSEEKYCRAMLLFHTPNPVIQFISNYAYYQYFLPALMPALTFTLKLLVQKRKYLLNGKEIFQKGKRYSSLLWKAFQISTNYLLLHRHLKVINYRSPLRILLTNHVLKRFTVTSMSGTERGILLKQRKLRQ